MSAYDACRLLALNFYSFVKNPFTKDAQVDYESLYKMAYEQQRLADNLIDLELEHIDRIIDKINQDPENDSVKRTELELWQNIRYIAESSRRTGCGFTALGDMLAALGLKYDSKEAMETIERVMQTKMSAELDCTIDLAILRGPFKDWDAKSEFKIDDDVISGRNDFYQFLAEDFYLKVKRMIKWGRRNVSWSTVAPTGSVSILTQTTSGLEPLFAPYYMRRKKVNPGETGVRVDFTDQNGDNWMEYPVLHPKFRDWLHIQIDKTAPDPKSYNIDMMPKSELEVRFQQSPWYGSIANDINWQNRVFIQSIIQKYTTHSISSTINLPNEISTEEVDIIYMTAFDANLKGVTVYRDGSRTGVLVTDTTKNNSFEQRNAPKRPIDLECDIKHLKVKGNGFTVIVGLLDNKPYEVFAIPELVLEGCDNGILSKKSKGRYGIIASDGKEQELIKDITHSMTDEQEAITRLISTALRHGAEIRFIVEQLQKTDGELHSFTKAIARTLKAYIPDGTNSTVSCLDCGSKSVVFEEGCAVCKECGSSKCG